MNKFTKEEQLGLLERGLQRRIVGMNPAIKQKEEQIEEIIEVRKRFTDRIEKYADDQVIVDMLEAQLTQYDRQYEGTKQQYIMAIEEIKESEPTVKKLIKQIETIKTTKKSGTLLYLMMDLFMKEILTDWNEMEIYMSQDKGEDDNGKE